MFSGTT